MRSYRLFLSLLAMTLVATIAPPAGAAPPAPIAETYAFVSPDEFGNALVVVACTGRGPAQESSRIVVACDLYDDSGGPSIHHERSYTGFAGACFIASQGARLPVEFCTTVTLTYRDLSKQSATQCSHAGEYLPPHNAPPSATPTATECFDLVNLSA